MLNLTGERFGRLLVVSFSHKENYFNYWDTLCDCGVRKVVRADALYTGKTKSCGCLNSEVVASQFIGGRKTHGMSHIKVYNALMAAISRCYNPNNPMYYRYGGRGIKVSGEFRGPGGFERFYECVGEPPTEKHTLDRIDLDGNYASGNIRWADKYTQANNKSNNVVIYYDGETHTAAEWGRLVGLDSRLIRLRLKLGWSVDDILTVPYKGLRSNKYREELCLR